MEFGELLKQFLIDLQSLFRIQLKQLNLTVPQIMLISSIPIDGIDMTSLSKKLGIDNSTLTRLVDILVKNEITEKTPNSSDKRSIILLLTKKGELLQLKIEEEIDLFVSALYQKIPMENREELKESLSSFLAFRYNIKFSEVSVYCFNNAKFFI